MQIQISKDLVDEVILRRMQAREREMMREFVQVGQRPAWAKRKGTKEQGRQMIPRWYKRNRKLIAQIAFAKGGKPARDAIYPPREVIYA